MENCVFDKNNLTDDQFKIVNGDGKFVYVARYEGFGEVAVAKSKPPRDNPIKINPASLCLIESTVSHDSHTGSFFNTPCFKCGKFVSFSTKE